MSPSVVVANSEEHRSMVRTQLRALLDQGINPLRQVQLCVPTAAAAAVVLASCVSNSRMM
jgi:hypothetical protein